MFMSYAVLLWTLSMLVNAESLHAQPRNPLPVPGPNPDARCRQRALTRVRLRLMSLHGMLLCVFDTSATGPARSFLSIPQLENLHLLQPF